MLYADCSLKYKFRYIDKIHKPAMSIHLAYGTAIHKGIEELNKSLLKSKIGLEDVFQYFHDSYHKELESMYLEKDYFRWTLYEMGLNSLEKFYNEYIDYEVLATEFKFTVAGQGDYLLTGFIDAIIKRKGQIMIVDYKTSKEQYKKFKIDTSLQLALYSYAFRKLLNEKKLVGNFPSIKKTEEDYIAYYILMKDYKGLTGNIKMQRKKIGKPEINRMLYTCKKVLEAEKAGIYIPNFASTCEWCEYKKECLAFTG